MTALLLLVLGPTGDADAVPGAATPVAMQTDSMPDAGQAIEEATGTLRELVLSGSALLPKIAIALVILFIAGVFVALLRRVLRRVFGTWSRASAASAGVGIFVWIIALGAALSVLTGDARTRLGSVGLLGLALSWALQAPIESFTAWVLNSFREYYRVGDRIAVGDVFGDVHRIDFLTTTVWETTRPDANGMGGGPTGGLITFPNSEVLRSNIVNYTRDFPWVWDEITVGVANESDIRFAMERAQRVAQRVLGEEMKEPAASYRAMLTRAGLDADIADTPQAFLTAADAWMNISIRYLVPARRKRAAATRLLLAISEDFAHEENSARIIGSYPVTRVEMIEDSPLDSDR
jgi:small-conductance mechanosensitive channel